MAADNETAEDERRIIDSQKKRQHWAVSGFSLGCVLPLVGLIVGAIVGLAIAPRPAPDDSFDLTPLNWAVAGALIGCFGTLLIGLVIGVVSAWLLRRSDLARRQSVGD